MGCCRRCLLERPLLVPLGSLVAGLCLADCWGFAPPGWALPLLLLTTLAASFVKGRFPFLLSLSLLFLVWGGVSLEPFLEPLLPPDAVARFASESELLLEGVVDERPVALSTGGGMVSLRAERLYRAEGERAVTGRVLLQIKEGRAELCTGDRILFSSKIRRPRALGLPGEMDYPRRLAYRGIFATAFVRGADDLVLVSAGEGWRHRIDLLAARLGSFVVEQAPGPEGGVLKAMLLGDQGGLPEELRDAYGRSGVNHILSISGFHVGIVFLSVFQLLFLLARSSEFLALRINLRKALLLAALPVVVFYLFLSGSAPATVRSVLMIAALMAALHLKREVDPVHGVMLAACVMLFASPQTLFDLSFQFSFLAIWGLVVLAPPLAARFQGQQGVTRWILLLITASAAAIMATLVPVAYHFQRVSLIGLPANLVIVPLLGYGAVLAGFASLPLCLVAPVPAGWLLQSAALLVRLSDMLVLRLARAPVLTCYTPTRLDLLLATLLLCAVTFPRSGRSRCLIAAPLLLALSLRAVPSAGTEAAQLRVTFLSVGQGDATLIRLPERRWMLVDGGGRAGEGAGRVGERLLPALRRLGVGRIDYLVLSHAHPDHLQGVLYLAANFEVGEFWESGVPSELPEYLQLEWVLAARGIPVRRVNGSQPPFSAGGALVEPLWPLGTAPPASGDANDGSLVLRLSHGKGSLLLTGDLGGDGERELLARGAPLHCTLLKVAHHGSKYSSTDHFLAAVSPEAAVISAGYQNPFHLPAPSTLKRLQRHGVRLYRTDLDGSVQAVFRADGSLEVATPWGHFN